MQKISVGIILDSDDVLTNETKGGNVLAHGAAKRLANDDCIAKTEVLAN